MDGSLLGYGIEELSEICEAVFRASFLLIFPFFPFAVPINFQGLAFRQLLRKKYSQHLKWNGGRSGEKRSKIFLSILLEIHERSYIYSECKIVHFIFLSRHTGIFMFIIRPFSWNSIIFKDHIN